jgi:hypothetical protein
MGSSVLDGYDTQGFYCEMLRCPETAQLRDRLARISIPELKRRAAGAEEALYNLGITFNVYSDQNAIDRILPFDAIPRVISGEEWRRIEPAMIQRVTALNLFLDDLYHEQKILKDRIIPADLILSNANYRPIMRGIAVRHKAYVNICGIDMIRDEDGVFRVLEDNARTPSGVSYVIENRLTMLRAFPDLLDDVALRHAGPGSAASEAAPGRAAAGGSARLSARQPVLRDRPSLRHRLVAVRHGAAGLGQGPGDLQLRPRACRLRIRARATDQDGVGSLYGAAGRVPGLHPSCRRVLSLHEHPSALLHRLSGRYRRPAL